jgi:uncharacterized caspase-like protein
MRRTRAFSLAIACLLLATPALAEKRVALVVGNSAYVNAPVLSNPMHDASDMAEALKQVGFEVVLGLDLTKVAFDGKVRDYARALSGADVAVFFYAGHGLQVALRNYLVPVDAKLESERDLDFEAIGLDFVLKQMEIDRENKTNIVFLDACRDNPLARNLARSMSSRSTSVGQGLAQVQTGVGTFISYSTHPGYVAADGTGRNSPFTGALVPGIKAADRSITSVMIDVRKEVLAATDGKQVPWDHSALTGDFYFHLTAAPGTLPKTLQKDPAEQQALEQRLREVEEELRKKSDPQITAKMISLSQARERVRSIEETNRQDQQRIFDVYRKYPGGDPNARMSVNREVGTIQMEMARRGQELGKLRDTVAGLEKELGLTGIGAAQK